nr:MAG TPA: hypothetical protein [Caudoviricetes sp.]
MIILTNRKSESTWLPLFSIFKNLPGCDFHLKFALFTNLIMKGR